MAVNRVGTILAADFGSVHTRAVLIDVVDGEYRIVARDMGLTTLGYPVDDLNVGLQRLLSQMGEVTGRKFYNSLGRVITPEDAERNGVDLFITTASAGRPIRAVMLGLIPDISIASAIRAISGTYIEAVAQIHLRDGRNEEERLNAILLSRPDIVFVAGGINGGAKNALLELLKVLELALKITDPELRPAIIYAGYEELHKNLEAMFGELTSLLLTDNIRPKMQEEVFEAITAELDKVYDNHRETHGDAFSLVSDMSNTGLLPTAQSYELVAEYFAKARKGNVIAVDMGSTSSVLAGVFNGRAVSRVSATKGLGHSADTLLHDVGEDAIAAWLPYYPEGSEIRNYALNKLSRPASIPLNLRDLFMEHGFLRAGLRQMLSEARVVWKGVEETGTVPPIKMIIAAGAALTNTGIPAYDMMLIADCLQPTGVTEIKTDPNGLIPAIGSLAKIQPAAAVQLLEGSNLEHLGTLISFEGNPKEGRRIATLRITTEDGEQFKVELKGGELLALPLQESSKLKIRISCARGISVGGKGGLNLTLSGGTGGILLDGRGRNFTAPQTVAERARIMPKWIQMVTDNPLLEIPSEWLIKPEVQLSEIFQLEEKRETMTLSALDDSEFPLLEDDGTDIFAETEEAEAEPADEDALGSLRDLLK